MPVSVVPVSHSPTVSVASTNHTITVSSDTQGMDREGLTTTNRPILSDRPTAPNDTITTSTSTPTSTSTSISAALPMPRNRHKHKRSFAISGDFDFLKQEQDAIQRQRQEQNKSNESVTSKNSEPMTFKNSESMSSKNNESMSSKNNESMSFKNNELNRSPKFYLSTGEETTFNNKGIPNALIDLDNVISTLNNTTLSQPSTRSSSGFVKNTNNNNNNNNNYNYNIRSKSSVVYSSTQSSSGKSSPLSSFYHQNAGFTNHRRSESAPAELDLDQLYDNNNYATNFAFGKYTNNSNHSLLNDNQNNICEEENEDMPSNPTSPLKECSPIRTPITPMDNAYNQRKTSVPPKMANTYRNIGRQKERYSNYQAYLTSFTNSNTSSSNFYSPPSTATSVASKNSTNFSVLSESNNVPMEGGAPDTASQENEIEEATNENITAYPTNKENLPFKLNNPQARRGKLPFQYQCTNTNAKWKQRQGMSMRKSSLQSTTKSQPFNFKTTVYDVDPEHNAFNADSTTIGTTDPQINLNYDKEVNRSPSPKTALLEDENLAEIPQVNQICNTNNDTILDSQKSPPPLKHMRSHSIAIGEQQSNNTSSASTTPRKTTPIPKSILMGEPGSAIELHNDMNKEKTPSKHKGEIAESFARGVHLTEEAQSPEAGVISADEVFADETSSTHDMERTPDSKKRRRSSHIFKSAVSLIRSASSTSLAQSFNSQYKGDRASRKSFFQKDGDVTDGDENQVASAINNGNDRSSSATPNMAKEKKKKKKLLHWLFKKSK
ncbi:hypothetical protein ACO0QE_002294 [Hanseniaspora vineae]